jgi:hypothetical protein
MIYQRIDCVEMGIIISVEARLLCPRSQQSKRDDVRLDTRGIGLNRNFSADFPLV